MADDETGELLKHSTFKPTSNMVYFGELKNPERAQAVLDEYSKFQFNIVVETWHFGMPTFTNDILASSSVAGFESPNVHFFNSQNDGKSENVSSDETDQ